MRLRHILTENADDRYLAMLKIPVRLNDGTTTSFRFQPGELAKYVRKARKVLKRQDRIVWAMRIFRAMIAAEILDLARRVPEDPVLKDWFGGHEPAVEQPELRRLEAQLEPLGAYALQNFDMHGWLLRQPIKAQRRRTFNRLPGETPEQANRRGAQEDRERDLTTLVDAGRYAFNGIDEINKKLGHWLGFAEAYADREPHNAILTTVFDRQSVQDIFKLFRKEELRLQKKYSDREGADGETIIEFPDGAKWVNLKRAYCPREAKAMGHCGNAPAKNSDQTILSLRVPEQVDGKTIHAVALTFILHGDGTLGEMKGRRNSKPKEEYHDYIVALLNHPMVRAVRGGGYAEENNFALYDLSPDRRKQLTHGDMSLEGVAIRELALPPPFVLDKEGRFWREPRRDYYVRLVNPDAKPEATWMMAQAVNGRPYMDSGFILPASKMRAFCAYWGNRGPNLSAVMNPAGVKKALEAQAASAAE